MTETIWRNSCVSCGEVVITHGDQPGQCPKCQGWAWLCHLESPGDTPEVVKQPIPNPSIMQPLDWTGKQDTMPKTGVGDKDLFDFGKLAENAKPTRGNGHRGRPATAIPETLLKELVSQGYGCKLIAQKLTEQGIPVHYCTISRLLNRNHPETLTVE